MNATAEHLDQFLQKADPSVARTVEAVVQQLLQLHSARADNFPARQPSANYQFPTRSLGVRPGIDLTRLAHFDEEQFMILIDANLLLYAVNTDAPDHALAKPWVEDALQGARGPIALSWFTLVAFVRVGTNPKALTSPFTLDQTIQIVGDWLRLPTVAIVGPGSHHFGHFEALCRATNAKGNLITDAHLAALAIEHNCALASCDTDFAKFPGLNWINPLVP